MTPETIEAALAGLRFEVLALKPKQTVSYWRLLDQFDHGDQSLSQALDAELRVLAKAGEVRIVESDEEPTVQRTGAKKPAAKKKKPAAKKKKPAPKKKAKQPAKKKRK